MRARFVGIVLACVAFVTRIHAQGNTLVFFASVVDSSGAPVATLAPEDLEVVENGAEGMIVKVEPIDWRIEVQLLIDNGTAMDSAVVQIRNGSATRIATLLPEIGAQVARSHARQSRQFRITFQRPNGASGPLGEVGAAMRAGLTPSLTVTGRLA
jgi:hypothetical protein